MGDLPGGRSTLSRKASQAIANNRDLRTFVTDLATTERLAGRAPLGALLVAESGIERPADAVRLERAGATAMLPMNGRSGT